MQARYITASLLIKTTGSVNPWADQRVVQALLSEFSGPPPSLSFTEVSSCVKVRKALKVVLLIFFNIVVLATAIEN